MGKLSRGKGTARGLSSQRDGVSTAGGGAVKAQAKAKGKRSGLKVQQGPTHPSCSGSGGGGSTGRAPSGKAAKVMDEEEVREALGRVIAEHTGSDADSGLLQPQSSQLWSLASAAVVEFLGWLPAEDQKKVKIMLPRLVGAEAGAGGGGNGVGGGGEGVSRRQFADRFVDLHGKLRLKREAEALLEDARAHEARGDDGGAEEAYGACLAAAPRNAPAHLGLALLLRSTARPCAISTIADHLRAAQCYASSPDVAQEAASKLALLLCQEDEEEDVEEEEEAVGSGAQRKEEEEVQGLLLPMGFRYRLADCVLRYGAHPVKAAAEAAKKKAGSSSSSGGGGRKARGTAAALATDGDRQGELIAVLDDALPQPLLKHLQEVFGRDSPFWSEHSYSSYPPSPYFSYLHPLGNKAVSPTSSLDQVIRFVQAEVSKHFPAATEARCAEWWAHCRPHTHGHQLHFDSDNEGEDGVRNPIVSTIVYLSEQGLGGPTLMTTQHVTDTSLASKGWLAFPRLNRLVAFDAEYLHGVIPGRSGDKAPPEGRRISLMIAFWRHNLKQRPRDDGRPGACIPRPVTSRGGEGDGADEPEMTSEWHGMLGLLPETWEATRPSRVAAQPVDAIWQDVDPELAESHGTSVTSLGSLPSYDLCFQGF